MGFLRNLLLLPVLGGPTLVQWIAKTLAEEAEREELDEDRGRGALLELQEQYETGDIEEAEYDREERSLLERLNTIREIKAGRG